MLLKINVHISRLISISLLLCLTVTGCSQKGINSAITKEDVSVHDLSFQEKFGWKAQWIWMADTSDVMIARRTFDLEGLPDTAVLRITASSQYQLYINGKYIRRGPARSAPHHQSFDILPIKELLQKGANVIAVRVHNQKGKFSYHHSGRAGLLVQLDLDVSGDHSLIISDSEWKVSKDPSWSNDSPRISRFQLVVNDRVDMRLKISDWNKLEFKDDKWKNAIPLMRNVGWPSPQRNAEAQALTPPWTSLIPRDVPYLIETEVRADNLIQAEQIDNVIPVNSKIPLTGKIDKGIGLSPKNYSRDFQVLKILPSEEGKKWLILFDFGKMINGTPLLNIQGAEATKVEVLCAPFIVDSKFSSRVVDSDFVDEIILSGSKDSWESTYFKPARYMGIVIQNQEPVEIEYAGIRQISYPFEKIGSIHSKNEPWIEQYMDASIKTIDVCTTDGYTDNYRERRQYAQTGYYAALGNYWTFGDHALQRRYLIQVAQEQEANGIMPAYAPLAMDDYMIILDSNCLWIRSLRNYLLYSGDSKTVVQLLPSARKLMELLHSYTNSLGLIYNPPYAYWMDHAQNDRRGANFCLNGHYLGALEDFSEILNWLGESDAPLFHQRGIKVRNALREKLWNADKGLFADAWIDGILSDQLSEHANAMALAMKVASPEQAILVADKILEDDDNNYIMRRSGMTMVTPAMSYFLHKGLCEYGFIQESFDLFRKRFDKMFAPEYNGTLWEEWWLDGTGRSGNFQGGRTRSDAQTESAFPPALIGEFLLGVQPLKPGWEQASISYHPSSIKHIKGVVPTPLGKLNVEWNISEEKGGELLLEVQEEMEVYLDINSLENISSQPIIINGNKLSSMQMKEDKLVLGKGNYLIKF